MVTAGLHVTSMGAKSNGPTNKQWYSLVKLDPYGLGHGACDGSTIKNRGFDEDGDLTVKIPLTGSGSMR